MRKPIVTLVLAALAMPAAAQAPHYKRSKLPPPHAIGALGNRAAAAADALMDVDLGPVVDAIEPGRRHRPTRLGDLAYPNDPYGRERLHRSITRSSARAEAAARQLEIVAPRLLATLLDARQRLNAALHAPVDAPPQGDYRAAPRYDRADPPAPGDYRAAPDEDEALPGAVGDYPPRPDSPPDFDD